MRRDVEKEWIKMKSFTSQEMYLIHFYCIPDADIIKTGQIHLHCETIRSHSYLFLFVESSNTFKLTCNNYWSREQSTSRKNLWLSLHKHPVAPPFSPSLGRTCEIYRWSTCLKYISIWVSKRSCLGGFCWVSEFQSTITGRLETQRRGKSLRR